MTNLSHRLRISDKEEADIQRKIASDERGLPILIEGYPRIGTL